MSILSWFDNRTLIACQCLLATLFTVVFFGMRRLYPTLRGVNSIAFSFLFGIPATILLAGRGNIPLFVSVMVANTFTLAAFIFFYRGILQSLNSRYTLYLPLAMAVISLAILFYYSQVHENIVPRIIALSISIGMIRALIAVELFRKASASINATIMRLFAVSMSFFAAASFNRGIMTYLHGAPRNYLQSNLIQTSTLLIGIASICLTGLFFLVLSSSELISNSRNESQQDALSGALNRRGIEAKLAAELNRVSRSGQKLSIALIDLDHFKSINDTYGHAAGDTALRQVSQTISERLRTYDSLGRFGGDEFLLILPQTPCDDALIVTSRLSHAVNSLTFANMPKTITLSIGLTQACNDDDATTLLARADKALYLAKNDGRNCRRTVLLESTSPETATISSNLPLDNILVRIPEPNLLKH
jgi:diguanylate cyclase (GGDEF)-like protein